MGDRSKVASIKIYDRVLYEQVFTEQLHDPFNSCGLDAFSFRNRNYKIDWDPVRQILYKNKSSTRMKDINERCVLHYACLDDNEENIIPWLLECNPNAVKQKDKVLFKYPLQYALGYHSNRKTGVVLKLIEMYHTAVIQKDDHGDYPLHMACKNNKSDQVVLKLLEIDPVTAIQHRNDDGYYPLHYACKYESSDVALLKLMELYPRAILERDQYRNYPLHLACQSWKSERVVLKLLELDPIVSVQQVGQMGDNHLHEKSVYGLSEKIIKPEILYPIFENGRKYRNYYPLHFACHFNQSTNVVLKLMELYPSAMFVCCDSGKYPLHLACEKKQSEEVVMKLIELFPRATNIRDNNGNYPLHLACANNQSEMVVLKLRDSQRNAALRKNGYATIQESEVSLPAIPVENNDGNSTSMANMDTTKKRPITKVDDA